MSNALVSPRYGDDPFEKANVLNLDGINLDNVIEESKQRENADDSSSSSGENIKEIEQSNQYKNSKSKNQKL